MKLTRRKMAKTVLAQAAAASAALAAPQQPAAGPEQELAAARSRLKSTMDTLAAQTVPSAIEPAFQFKA